MVDDLCYNFIEKLNIYKQNDKNIIIFQKHLRGFLCRKDLLNLKDGMDFTSLNKYINGYNDILKVIIDINPKLKNKIIRKINYPSEITENIVKFALAKKYKVMGNWDIKPGDLTVLSKKIEVKGGYIFNGPPTFGPTETWDWIYFVDCENTLKNKFKIYEIKKSNIDFRNLKVNNNETFGNHADQKRRPRIIFKLIQEYFGDDCKMIFDGNISELI